MKNVGKKLFLLVLALLLVACQGFEKKEAAEEILVSVTDMLGRQVQLRETVERIVVLIPSDVEIIYALGCGEKIVGRSHYCDYPQDVLDVPAVASGNETNIEQILALKPQLVIMSTMAQSEEQVNALEVAGVRVAVSDAHDTIEGTFEAIEMIGCLLSKEEEAQKIIGEMKAVFAAIAPKDGETKKTIYFEVSPPEFGPWTAGRGTFMNEIANLMGLENIFSDIDGWAEVSQEQIIKRNPDCIVTISGHDGVGLTPDEKVLIRKGWQNVQAVKEGQVIHVGNNELSRPGPRLALGAKMIYEFIYGELELN